MSPDLGDYTLSAKQAADRLHVDRSTIWRMSERGLIPHAKTLGGQRRYRPEDIDAIAQRLERGESLEPIEREG